MRDGIGPAFVAGLLPRAACSRAGDEAVDHAKIAVKFAVGLVSWSW